MHAFGNMALFYDLFQWSELFTGCFGKDRKNRIHLSQIRHLIEAHPDQILIHIEKVDLLLQSQRANLLGTGNHLDRIKNTAGRKFITQFFESFSNSYCMSVGIERNAANSFSSVINGKEPGHCSQQRLSCTDIRRSTFTFDMLFAHLQRHTQRFVSQSVDRNADDTTRHITFVGIARCQIGCMRTAKAHRNTETLSRTNHDIGTPFAWSLQQSQTQNICCHGNQYTTAVSCSGKIFVIAHLTVGSRILHNSTELPTGKGIIIEPIADNFNSERFATGQQEIQCLREDVLIDKEHIASLFDRLT